MLLNHWNVFGGFCGAVWNMNLIIIILAYWHHVDAYLSHTFVLDFALLSKRLHLLVALQGSQ